MGWLRTLRYWLAGGKRRWFARKAKRLPAGLPGQGGAGAGTARGGAVLEAIAVGLEVDPERALKLLQACEPHAAEACTIPALEAEREEILRRAARMASGPAWSIGWILAKHAKHADHLKTFGRGLALHRARAGEIDALVLHLDEHMNQGLLDQELLDAVLKEASAHQSLERDASWLLCLSFCHERLGDLTAALRSCPTANEERRLLLVERLEQDALAIAARGDASGAMAALVKLRELVAEDTRPSAAWLSRCGVLERHRAELLAAGRKALQDDLAARPAEQRREALLRCSAFEELAGEWSGAALLLEQAGELADRLRASQLWERDEQYGEAVRALGPLSDRDEVQLRMAQLRESGGDPAGAAVLFEHLRRWSDARRAHEAAGQWLEAARCYRQEHGEAGAARSPEYGRLLVEAGRADELLQLLLDQLAADPKHRALLERLRRLLRDHEGELRSPRLREAAARHLEAAVHVDLRGRFERSAAGWIDTARAEVLARYGRVWGMDLGTSKSAVAVFDLKEGAAVICPHKGQPHFPSTLSLDKSGNEIVGLSALEQLRPDLRGCIEGAKRAMGTRKVYRIGERHFSPEEVAARLLTHGRGLAEAFVRDQIRARAFALARESLGDDCAAEWLDAPALAERLAVSMPGAVVTIPAYFNFDQRRATRDAAEIAGLKVHRLMPEPTAACLRAGMARELPGRMMVVDLGAGTLDLTYLDASYLDQGEGFFDVKEIFGDTQFGSSDFDAVLEKHFVAQLQGAGLGELTGLDRRRLHAAAEQIKIALSSSQTASHELVSFAGRDRYTLELTAARLEALLTPLLERLEATCRKAAGLRIDHLVLVGGPMFSPLVRRRIEELFGRKADAVVDPRTAVAMGAAYQGALSSDHAKVPLLLLDIVPFALGVLAKADANAPPLVSFHIPRGTRIPHQSRKPYSTIKDNQTAVDVEVYQGLGESPDPAASSRLAVIHLEGIPPARAGEPKIDVSFEIDANGLLEVTAKDERTGQTRSLRIEDAIWLSPADREAMTQRLTRSQRWAGARAALAALVQQVRARIERLQALERGGAAGTWQRQFEAWQRGARDQSFGHLEAADQALLAEMYTTGQLVADQWQLGLDRARNLVPRGQRFATAADELTLLAADADIEQQLQGLQELGRQLDGQTREAVAALEPLALRFQRWSSALVHFSTLHADPRDRLIACHDAGDWQRALEAYHAAFGALPAAEVPAPALHRRLDNLARLGRREEYRQVLAEGRERLALLDLQFDRLNEFARHVRLAVAWIFVSGRGTGSGFLAAPDQVATNRHVVAEGEHSAVPDGIRVQVGGALRSVARVRFPPNPEIDLAILELDQPLDVRPVRIGYSGLVEVGERVLALGFPLPEGESFDENLLLDHGIVNRIRTRPDRHGRELELGLKISAGMSGGPIFNDRGEVIAASTFVRFQAAGGGPQPAFLERSSHAIAIDALHELLPRPW